MFLTRYDPSKSVRRTERPVKLTAGDDATTPRFIGARVYYIAQCSDLDDL